jgi:integrase
VAKSIFAKSESQSASVMKELQGSVIKSVGTVRNYEQALKTCCDYLKEFKLGALRDMTPESAELYLSHRSEEVSQSALNMDRGAIQAMMRHVTHALAETGNLDSKIKSTQETILNSRGYTPLQVAMITSRQTEPHALSTRICHEAGLRVHELLTLRGPGETSPSPRDNIHPDKFNKLPNEVAIYTVQGKGGLIREVALPTQIARELETYRRDTPVNMIDRGINYSSHYNIPAGHKFSSAFGKASNRALGYSNGAHGLRHSYAQDRYEQLANYYPRDDVMRIISQELGHFRPDVTEVYLR